MSRSDLIDAEPVRAHVGALIDSGWARHQVTAVSGVRAEVVRQLIAGRREIRVTNAAKLLAIPLDPVAVDPWTNPVGTRRRLQALFARRWSRRYLAERVGVHPVVLWRIATGDTDTVEASIEQRIHAVHDELWNQRPGPDSVLDATSTAHVKQHGWVTTGWWDDIDRDTDQPVMDEDPTYVDVVAVDRAVSGISVRLTDAEKVEAARRLAGRPDCTPTRISVFCRVNGATAKQWFDAFAPKQAAAA